MKKYYSLLSLEI